MLYHRYVNGTIHRWLLRSSDFVLSRKGPTTVFGRHGFGESPHFFAYIYIHQGHTFIISFGNKNHYHDGIYYYHQLRWSSPASFSSSCSAGRRSQDQICSCAPTVFNFVLDLSVEATTPSDDGECAFNTIAGNPGVEFSLCRQAVDGATP